MDFFHPAQLEKRSFYDTACSLFWDIVTQTSPFFQHTGEQNIHMVIDEIPKHHRANQQRALWQRQSDHNYCRMNIGVFSCYYCQDIQTLTFSFALDLFMTFCGGQTTEESEITKKCWGRLLRAEASSVHCVRPPQESLALWLRAWKRKSVFTLWNCVSKSISKLTFDTAECRHIALRWMPPGRCCQEVWWGGSSPPGAANQYTSPTLTSQPECHFIYLFFYCSTADTVQLNLCCKVE